MAWPNIPTANNNTELNDDLINNIVERTNESAAAKATTAGQLFVSDGTNSIEAVGPPGSAQEVLISDGTNTYSIRRITYDDITGADPIEDLITAVGQLLVGSGVDTFTVLNIGTNGQILGVVSNNPAWVSVLSQITFENLRLNDDIGNGIDQVSVGNHNHFWADSMNSFFGITIARG